MKRTISQANEFDLAIIGGGSAAFAAALRASELGATALLVNEGTIGGTCVNVGCIPSKTLIRAAENHHWNGLARFRGVKPEQGDVDFGELLREKDELVQGLRRMRYEDVLSGLSNLRYIEGKAALVGPNEIGIEGSRFRAERILVATGTRPAIPDIPGLSETGVWNSTQALEAPGCGTAPRHLRRPSSRKLSSCLVEATSHLSSRRCSPAWGAR